MKKFDTIREEALLEKLKASDPTGKWISDFVHSDNPKFAGKSKKERIRMALGASYAAKRNEEVEQIDEISKETAGKYLTAPQGKGANKYKVSSDKSVYPNIETMSKHSTNVRRALKRSEGSLYKKPDYYKEETEIDEALKKDAQFSMADVEKSIQSALKKKTVDVQTIKPRKAKAAVMSAKNSKGYVTSKAPPGVRENTVGEAREELSPPPKPPIEDRSKGKPPSPKSEREEVLPPPKPPIEDRSRSKSIKEMEMLNYPFGGDNDKERKMRKVLSPDLGAGDDMGGAGKASVKKEPKLGDVNAPSKMNMGRKEPELGTPSTFTPLTTKEKPRVKVDKEGYPILTDKLKEGSQLDQLKAMRDKPENEPHKAQLDKRIKMAQDRADLDKGEVVDKSGKPIPVLPPSEFSKKNPNFMKEDDDADYKHSGQGTSKDMQMARDIAHQKAVQQMMRSKHGDNYSDKPTPKYQSKYSFEPGEGGTYKATARLKELPEEYGDYKENILNEIRGRIRVNIKTPTPSPSDRLYASQQKIRKEKGLPDPSEYKKMGAQKQKEIDALKTEAKKMKGKDPCWDDYKMIGTKMKGGKEVPNCVPEEVELAEAKPGLYANIHAKRKRIERGSGERMRKPGTKGAPTAQAFKDAAKTAKK